MKHLKPLSELTWFDIKTYDCVSTWDDDKLFWQLNERRNALIESDISHKQDSDLTLDMIELALLRKNAEFQIFGRGTRRLSGGRTIFGEFIGGHQDEVVKSVSSNEIHVLFKFLLANPNATLEEAVREKSTIGKHRYVKVNMSANRSLIKEEFSQWLDTAKFEGHNVDDLDSAKEAVREKINTYNIIPYIDLRIWENLNQTKINRSGLVQVLLPAPPAKKGKNADKDKDKVKTLSKETGKLADWARKVLSNSFLASLRTT
jgi:hypothetical protein